jgi:enamine deaminase RidA (YjgF/YER057c/UK114 family)
MTVKTVNPAGSEFLLENFHFSQAAWNGDTLLCSGQIGMTEAGTVPEEPSEEFRTAWQRVMAVLAEAGLGAADIVEYTTYHVELQRHMNAFMAVRDEFLAAPWPAWTAIGITELAVPGARVEIRVTARKS